MIGLIIVIGYRIEENTLEVFRKINRLTALKLKTSGDKNKLKTFLAGSIRIIFV